MYRLMHTSHSLKLHFRYWLHWRPAWAWCTFRDHQVPMRAWWIPGSTTHQSHAAARRRFLS